jgi:hypothetical protein
MSARSLRDIKGNLVPFVHEFFEQLSPFLHGFPRLFLVSDVFIQKGLEVVSVDVFQLLTVILFPVIAIDHICGLHLL